jgi:hypothetical protein
MPYDVYFKPKDVKIGVDFRFYHQFSRLDEAKKVQTRLRSLGFHTHRERVR